MTAGESMALAELVQKVGEGDFLRTVAEAVLQLLMEADVEGLIGAARHERSAERLNYRNGYRDRALATRLGSLCVCAAGSTRCCQGSYFPPFLEPRKMTEKAPVAVIHDPLEAGSSISGGAASAGRRLVQAMGVIHLGGAGVAGLCGESARRRITAILKGPLEAVAGSRGSMGSTEAA